MIKDYGCLYIAFGRPYLIQALNSFSTLRKKSPNVPVCIITNTFPEVPFNLRGWNKNEDIWLYAETLDNQNRQYKTNLCHYTPFQKNLYLDCDTEILNDITSTFDFLAYWDIALYLKDSGYSPKKEKGRQMVLDGKAAVFELPHWNSGVMLFERNQRIEDFFSLWNRYYNAGSTKYDQASLVEALFRSSCRVLSLDGRWNSGIDWGTSNLEQKRYVLHYMYGITNKIAQRLIDLDREIYGVSLNGDASDISSFIRKRQELHLRRMQSHWQSSLQQLARRLKKKFGRIL